MNDDVTDAIEANAQAPQRIKGDMGEVEEHSLPDQIAADRYLRAKASARTSRTGGLRFTKLVPPGID